MFATALSNAMTLDDLANLGQPFARPFAPLWDPVLIPAHTAWQEVDRTLQDA